MEEERETVDVEFHLGNECAVCAGTGKLETLEEDAYSGSDDFTVDVEAEGREGEEENRVDGEEEEEEGCCRENLDNCCGDNARGIRTCACCLKQCTGEIYNGCRRIDYKSWLKNTFNVDGLKDKFPILKWLPKYRLNHFLGDVIAGVTVGLAMIPKCVAMAKIALLPPEYGIYTAMTCVFVYIIFGSAKDVNLGPSAEVALLVSKFAKSPIEGDATYAIVLSLMCGVVQFFCGVFHLGFLVNYVSYPVLQSFTTTAVVTIVFGQVRNWFGLTDIPNEFLDQVYWTFKKLPETKIWDFVLGLICMIALFLIQKSKTTSCMKTKATSIPGRIFKYMVWLFGTANNAVVLIFAIVAAYLFSMNGMQPFTLTGEIPAGLPPFKPPAFSVSDGNGTVYNASDIFQQINIGILIVPLISYIEIMAIAKNFGRKNNYKADKNQELIACGVANIVGSFLSAFPVAGTFSGSAVNYQSGVKTTGGGFYTGVMVMLVLLFLTPVFYYIPNAALAVLNIMAVVDLADFGLIVKLWNVKKIDLLPWFVTFICGLCLGIENGIIFGIIVALGILLFPASRPKVHVETKGSQISIASSNESEYVIMEIEQGLMFPSVDYFVEHVMDAVLQGGSCVYKSVILDFVHVFSVDFSVVEGLQQLTEDFAVMGVKLILCRVRRPVQKVLIKSGIKKLICVKDVEEAVHLFKQHAPSIAGDVDTVSNHTSHTTIFVVSSMLSADDGVCLEMDCRCSSQQTLDETLDETKGKTERSDSSLGSSNDEAIDVSDSYEQNDPSEGYENFSYDF